MSNQVTASASPTKGTKGGKKTTSKVSLRQGTWTDAEMKVGHDLLCLLQSEPNVFQ